MAVVNKAGIALIVIAALACGLARAESASTAGATNATPPAGAEIDLQEQVIARDPFWPIGYLPPAAAARADAQAAAVTSAVQAGTGAAQVQGPAGLLRIGGVVKRGRHYYATINGMAVQTGEVVTVVSGGQVSRFRVEKISLRKVEVKQLRGR